MTEHFTPAEQAMVDQHRAEVREHVARIRAHWAAGTCEWGGADTEACISEVDKDVLEMPSALVRALYMEALVLLVKGEGHGEAQGG